MERKGGTRSDYPSGVPRAEGYDSYAELIARNFWVGCDGTPLLEEVRGVRVWDPSLDVVMIDLSVKLMARNGGIVFGDTKEVGLASIRVVASMEVEEGGRMENSEGALHKAQVWGRRASWCDYSGTVDGEGIGVAILDHPSNLRHPTYWHARDYGLMTANCFGISAFERDPSNDGRLVVDDGGELNFNYRIYVHRGDAKCGSVAEAYEGFSSSELWLIEV